MPLTDLNSKTIGDLNHGIVGRMIDSALANAVNDIDDRGEDGKPRKVVITLNISKRKKAEGIAIDAAVKATIPNYQSDFTDAEIATGTTGKGGRLHKGLKFRDDNPDRVDQPTFRDHGDKE